MSLSKPPTLRGVSSTSSRSAVIFSPSSKGDSDKDTGASYGIDLKKFRAHCEELKPFTNAQKNELDEENHQKIQNIAKLASEIHDKPIYQDIVKIVGEVFGDVTKPEPGSVSSFLRGCYTESKFKGRSGCSPTCAGSLPLPNIPGRDFCKNHVGHYRDGKFERLHRPVPGDGDSTIYIHVSGEKKFEMAQEDVDDLIASGIKFAIVTPFNNGKFDSEPSTVKISDLPIFQSLTQSSSSSAKSKSSSQISPKSSQNSSKSLSQNSSKSSSQISSKSSQISSKSSSEKLSKPSSEKSSTPDNSSPNSRRVKPKINNSGVSWLVVVVVIIFVIIIIAALIYLWKNKTTMTQRTVKNEYILNNNYGWSSGGPGVTHH